MAFGKTTVISSQRIWTDDPKKIIEAQRKIETLKVKLEELRDIIILKQKIVQDHITQIISQQNNIHQLEIDIEKLNKIKLIFIFSIVIDIIVINLSIDVGIFGAIILICCLCVVIKNRNKLVDQLKNIRDKVQTLEQEKERTEDEIQCSKHTMQLVSEELQELENKQFIF